MKLFGSALELGKEIRLKTIKFANYLRSWTRISDPNPDTEFWSVRSKDLGTRLWNVNLTAATFGFQKVSNVVKFGNSLAIHW